ncbi:MAG: dephospho-CoA kinase [Xanthomonadales bacterium]|nr:dephospho-CoA kinase [Xanthomonadales bacterium]
MNALPFSVALTGGIASGKSAVADRFAALGAGIIDADIIAREVVARGQPALDEIVEVFGAETLDRDGHLDRRGLRERVFSDDAARRRLEAIVHPRVRAAILQQAARSGAPYVMPVIPLLYERRADYGWLHRVLVVEVPRALQRRRLVARDRIDAGLADAILDAQASNEERRRIADDVLENTGSLAELDAAVRALHGRYMAMAS